MENVNLIITIIESIVSLAILGVFIWGCTKSFGLKGFVLSLSGFLILFLGIDLFEKFINYSIDNKPILITIFFAVIAMFLLWIIYITVKENLTSGVDIKRKFIKDSIQQLKILGLSLLGGALIVGLILASIMHRSISLI